MKTGVLKTLVVLDPLPEQIEASAADLFTVARMTYVDFYNSNPTVRNRIDAIRPGHYAVNKDVDTFVLAQEFADYCHDAGDVPAQIAKLGLSDLNVLFKKLLKVEKHSYAQRLALAKKRDESQRKAAE